MEDYSDRTEFNESYLKSLIDNEAEENVHLEFKEARALNIKDDKVKENISKDVSSFANSDGGIIIYGIKEAEHKAKEFSFIDGNEITKEWLEQVINSRIQRVIDGIRIFPIRIGKKISQTIYVVKIPISNDAPRQASDNKCYKRYNFQSVPMQEYEVRQLYERKLPSKLCILPPIMKEGYSSISNSKLRLINYAMSFRVENIGNSIEKNYKLEVQMPKILKATGESPIFENIILSNKDIIVYSLPNQSPIFQNEITTLAIHTFTVDFSIIKALSRMEFKLKLYYTSGIDEKVMNFFELLTYEGRSLKVEDFLP